MSKKKILMHRNYEIFAQFFYLIGDSLKCVTKHVMLLHKKKIKKTTTRNAILFSLPYALLREVMLILWCGM